MFLLRCCCCLRSLVQMKISRLLPMQADSICAAGGEAQAVTVDVCVYQQQRDMFEAHMKAYGKLDFAVLNAGIAETGAHAARIPLAGSDACGEVSHSCLSALHQHSRHV